jgi:hypothetical protein
MVYQHLEGLDTGWTDWELMVHYQTRSTHCHLLDQPDRMHWSMHPAVTSPMFSREVVQTMYRKCTFTLNTGIVIGRALDEDSWKRSIDPKQMISHMEITIARPLEGSDYVNDTARCTEVVQNLELLHGLRNKKAHLDFNLPSVRSYSVELENLTHHEEILSENLTGDYTDQDWREAMKADWEEQGTLINRLCQPLLTFLVPTLERLRAEGHTIRLQDPDSMWTWTSTNREMVLDEMWQE